MEDNCQTNKAMAEGQHKDGSLPLLSIIVPTYKRAEYIERCLVSLFKETEDYYPNTEIIVIDGGSEDGTVELLKEYGSKIAYWVSERDSGISEAVNKGLTRARGEIVYIIGDDDELLPGSALYMVRYLEEHLETDGVFAVGEYFKESATGDLVKISVPPPPAGRLTLESFLSISAEFGSPAVELQFTRKRVFDQFGGYDLRFNFWAPLDMWCRHVKSGAVFQQVSRVIAKRYYTPKSSNTNIDWDSFWKEKNAILLRHGGRGVVFYGAVKSFVGHPRRSWQRFLEITFSIRSRLGLRRKTLADLIGRKLHP